MSSGMNTYWKMRKEELRLERYEHGVQLRFHFVMTLCALGLCNATFARCEKTDEPYYGSLSMRWLEKYEGHHD